ncbi:MAG: hypothetical protein RLZ35_980 [Pseudomonadota bacterium]
MLLFCRTILKNAVLVVMVCMSSIVCSACHFPPKIYRINIEQGNIFKAEQVSKLKRGMSKADVQAVLGTSLLPHYMHADRWDYYYSFVSGENGKQKQKHLVLHFKKDKLVSIKSWAEDEFTD